MLFTIWGCSNVAHTPNNSFKPKPLRYTKGMAGKACHAFGSTTRFGLTQALGAMSKTSATLLKIGIAVLLGIALVAALVITTPKPWTLTIIGMCLGCLSGYIRSRAVGPGKPARAATAFTWLCGIGLMVLAMAFAEDMFI